MIRSILQEAQSRNELAILVDIDRAVAQLIGSYNAFSIAGDPILPDWPQRVVDQVLAGILGEVSEHDAYYIPASTEHEPFDRDL